MSGRLVEPATGVPAVLFVHGWAGSQERDTRRARLLAQLGFVCFTFDLRGHGDSSCDLRQVTREDNLADVCKAYDFLAGQPHVDLTSIAVIGSSYGGYLAAILTARRPVRWLGLRVPALYRDEDWTTPKFDLDRSDLAVYRRSLIAPDTNVALDRCRSFGGDVLIVESENDELVPHPAVASYLSSFVNAKSVTYRVISGADHALSDKKSKQAYDELLSHWLREMIFGAR
ncbi:MAG: alpha/beta hydrolase family protein [Aliihoeflea sp.]|uniref:alpha/beta hydrolase family protein n=1 Tax=Aliihoeflea sp. TaxID=2608088 RepID=UPI004037B337